MRGRDQSVSDPTRAEAIAARIALEIDDTIPLVRLEIPGADGSPQFFVTTAPRATPYTPPGCANAWLPSIRHCAESHSFFERFDLPNIQAEGLTYETLRKEKVRNVPHCHVSGDILLADYHATKTHRYATKPWACHSHAMFIPHRCYRLALDVIGRSLTTFKSSYEMVAAVRDALYALKDAFDAGILHHDFSPGNVLVVKDDCELLIDWDLSSVTLSLGGAVLVIIQPSTARVWMPLI